MGLDNYHNLFALKDCISLFEECCSCRGISIVTFPPVSAKLLWMLIHTTKHIPFKVPIPENHFRKPYKWYTIIATLLALQP